MALLPFCLQERIQRGARGLCLYMPKNMKNICFIYRHACICVHGKYELKSDYYVHVLYVHTAQN